jgi:hypothetical protein
MISRFQFARSVIALSLFRRRTLVPLGIAALLSCANFARAREGPPVAVGRVEGSDVTVEGGTAASPGTATGTPGTFVANGDVVTVHSGQARMTLTAGGHLDICGPAKLTVLEANGDITVALNFGRVHIELPASTSLRIFTPSIIATPIDIGGAQRDVAVGLNLDDSLCVLATSGALELEHQFTGEKLIVPQLGEFFLSSGQLIPVAGAPGSCTCAEMETRAIIPQPPPLSQPAPSDVMLTVPPATAPPASAAAPALQPTAPEPSVSYSVLGHADENRPIVPTPKNAVPPAPVVTVPIYTAVAPLTYSAGDPIPPPDPDPDMVLLIREARVDPDWEFSGHVDAPGFAEAMQSALGESPAPVQSQAPAINQLPGKQKKGGGFWSGLKRLFGRSGP